VRILVASGNRSKAAEIAAILAAGGGGDLEVLTLADVRGVESPEETGSTFLENAGIKARAAAAASGLPALADDSGLCVDALGGAPGVLSARYAEGGDGARCAKLLLALRDVPAGRRGARFACAAVLALPDGREISAEGTCEGEVAFTARGENGFGYDPVFLLPDGRTMAELSPGEKAVVSHRGRALRAIAPKIVHLLKTINKDT
jgi:XTP/dITP diphosphohydrolase